MLPVIYLYNIRIYPYGMMMGIGIASAVILFEKKCKRLGFNEDSAFNAAIISVIGGLIGSKIFYYIVEYKEFLKNPLDMIKDFGNGFLIYGGVAGGVLAAYLYTRKKGWPFLKIFDIAAPFIALAQGFGRIGCLFAGCCYGKETRSVFSIRLNNSPFAPHDVNLIPTQIISSIVDFSIFAILIIFDNRKKNKNDGETGALYLLLYGIARFIIEYFRGDPRGTVFNIMSTSQFICIFAVAASIIMFRIAANKRRKAIEEFYDREDDDNSQAILSVDTEKSENKNDVKGNAGKLS
ncbi:MAG: prolipoprotein diacylglyceryl transferase [Clostridiales bacterium]|nr:prolipoprotein diacylglyceryl transferase [Clostridiales bacterium]